MCKINGRMVTVNELKDYMKDIIDIHGQHENQSILDAPKHIEYLDFFAGDELLNLKNEYKENYENWNNLKKDLAENFGNDIEKQRRLDLLKYQLNEIDNAKLKIGEDEELEARKKGYIKL